MNPGPQPWLSVVIPILDEKENLIPLTEKLLQVLSSPDPSQIAPFEILYIDDGSIDGSGALLDQLAKDYAQIHAYHLDRNYGQSAALDAGLHKAQGKIIATLDGDLQNDPSDLNTLLPYLGEYDLVCGWRKNRKDKLSKRISARMAYRIRNWITRDGIHDSGCSLKVFRREVIENMSMFEGMHRFLPALAKMHGFKVTEVAVQHYPRRHGDSKYGIGNRLFKVFFDFFALWWMKRRTLHYRFRENSQK